MEKSRFKGTSGGHLPETSCESKALFRLGFSN